MSITERKTLGQLRGDEAWNCVNAVLELGEEERSDYAIEAQKLPIRIKASGLGQALAFLAAKAKKKKKGANLLLTHLSNWVLEKRQAGWSGDASDDSLALLHAVITRDSEFLRWATDETMGFLEWLNRFTDACDVKGD